MRSGKSEAGSACRVKRERPARSTSWPASPVVSRLDLRAVRELARDVVDHMGGNSGRAFLGDVGRDGLGRLEVEIGALQRQFAALGLDQHIGEDRNGVAPLDDAMHVSQAP